MKWLDRILENETVYRLWQASYAEAKLDPIRRHNELSAARSVLDVGCGPGTNTRHFSGAEYVGLDVNPRYTEYARRRWGREFMTVDAVDYRPPAGRTFDFILLNSFLHHIDTPGVERILGRLPALLAPGGHVHVLDLVLPERRGLARALARLDRGEHPRPLEEWRRLFSRFLRPVVFEPYPLKTLGATLWQMVYFKGAQPA